jgi:tetrahydromethanopterin S-methyltransferase subunit A
MKPTPLKTLKIYQETSETFSLEDIASDLAQISKIKKCSFCGCNADTLKEFEQVARQEGREDLAEQAQALREGIQKRYECIGCQPCYPADISNLLFERSNDSRSAVRPPDASSCALERDCGEKWPVEKGDYFVGNLESPVAICTLADTDLPRQIYSEMQQRIAIAGYCETENIGVEKVVKNIVANPYIRWLVLCGRESGKEKLGHFSGQAILALHANGVSEQGRIIGATGKRPILKNVTPDIVKRFQSQVELIDLIGNNSTEAIFEMVGALVARNAKKFNGGAVKPYSKDFIVAQTPERLVLDKQGFFVILPQKEEGRIYVEHYANSGERLGVIVGTNAPSIYHTLIENGWVSRLDHAAYLGKELTKAEYFLKYDVPYTQDKALGELEIE